MLCPMMNVYFIQSNVLEACIVILCFSRFKHQFDTIILHKKVNDFCFVFVFLNCSAVVHS